MLGSRRPRADNTSAVLTHPGPQHVAGADVRVFSFEKAVLPCLRATGRKVAIVNDQGRVVLSNSARHVSGTLLRAELPAYRIEDLPLSVVELSA